MVFRFSVKDLSQTSVIGVREVVGVLREVVCPRNKFRVVARHVITYLDAGEGKKR